MNYFWMIKSKCFQWQFEHKHILHYICVGLFVCFMSHLRIFFLTLRHHHYQWRTEQFKPMLLHWASVLWSHLKDLLIIHLMAFYDKQGGWGVVPLSRRALFLTLPFSVHRVNMTMFRMFCSHTILQKSSRVEGRGPWVTTYSLLEVNP